MKHPGRIFEWFIHSNSVVWAVAMSMPGAATTLQDFSSMAETGAAAVLGITGTTGLMALWANGHKPEGSPRFRALAAAASIYLYVRLAWALLAPHFTEGAPISLFGLFASTAVLFCLYSVYRSSREAPRWNG